MTPLHEDKPFLTGAALKRRLTELEGLAHEENTRAEDAKAKRGNYRARASTAGQAHLKHVRRAGEHYDEIRWRLGSAGRWGRRKKQLVEKHGIAIRTLDQYRDVARNWHHPKIEEARAQGVVIDSIKKFMAIKRSGPPKTPPKVKVKDVDRKNATAEIRRVFNQYLKSLDHFEVGILADTDVLDGVLAAANADLKERVCGNYGGPYYKHRDEYHREGAAKREREEERKRQAELEAKPKRIQRTIKRRQAAKATEADMKKAEKERWNELPVRGNTTPPTKPRRGRKPKPR